MIASAHIADVGVRSALALLRKTPDPENTPGLRNANVALAAPLRSSVIPRLSLRRVALIAFWDDDDALDRFLSDHPLASALASGWHVRLAPLRAWGSWPGLPEDISTARSVEHEGPAAVLTLGRLRLPQAVRFLRSSAKASAGAAEASGLIWATGIARPPFVATCSLWASTRALSTYAYGRSHMGHPDAIAADQHKPFHHQSAFIRFRPYGSSGSLEAKNPLAEAWMAAA
jgi:hypothetical protein